MFNIPQSPEGLPNINNEPDNTEETFESLDNDNLLMVNITAEFDNETIKRVEEEFEKSYVELEGNEIDYFGITVYFYDASTPNMYLINFTGHAKIELLGDLEGRIIDLIKHLNGKVLD